MKNKTLLCTLCIIALLGTINLKAQTFAGIWNGNMPNSKGVVVKDSIANERIYQVSNPGVYTFLTSKRRTNMLLCSLYLVADMPVWPMR